MTLINYGLKFDTNLHDVRKFIKKNDKQFDGKLKNYYNFSRVVSLTEFEKIVDFLGIHDQEHIGVISGSKLEPELKLLSAKQVTFLNFSQDVSYDLDENWENQLSKNFSLSICNQVLEHVFNPLLAVKNIAHHTRSGGYIYLTIPVINCIHGEPYFYSSGYHPRFLERVAAENGLKVINIGWWGSHKYLINAVGGRWLTERQLGVGIHGLNDLLHPGFIFNDGRINSERYMTDCWALLQK